MAKRRKTLQEGVGTVKASPPLPAPPLKPPERGVYWDQLKVPELNENQKKFARIYARDGNATQAYRRAYKNENLDTCRNNGTRLLANACIADYVELMRERDRQKLDFTREKALHMLTSIAANPRDRKRHDAIESLWEKLGLGNIDDTRDRKSTLGRLCELGKGLGRSGKT